MEKNEADGSSHMPPRKGGKELTTRDDSGRFITITARYVKWMKSSAQRRRSIVCGSSAGQGMSGGGGAAHTAPPLAFFETRHVVAIHWNNACRRAGNRSWNKPLCTQQSGGVFPAPGTLQPAASSGDS